MNRWQLLLSTATAALSALFGGPLLPATVGAQAPAQQVLPRPDFHFKGEVRRTYLDSDPATFPQIVRPPKGVPNVLLILLDDVGFGQFSVFGGGVPSPNTEKLAQQGLRYNRSHTTALCSPTPAALLTGRDHHLVGTGGITEIATGYDGYTSIIPKSAGTVAEILRQNGYATGWAGEGRVEQTAPIRYSTFESQDMGEDAGSPVDFSYKPPFKFTGKLGKVTVELRPTEGGGSRALK